MENVSFFLVGTKIVIGVGRRGEFGVCKKQMSFSHGYQKKSVLVFLKRSNCKGPMQRASERENDH